MNRERFHVPSLHCSEECRLIKKSLTHVKGIENLSFDLLNRMVEISYDPLLTNSSSLLEAIASSGLKIDRGKKRYLLPSFHPLSSLLSALLLGLGFTLSFFTNQELLSHLSYLGAIIIGGTLFLPKAISAARRLSFDMHLLMTIAVIGAISIGQLAEAATVTFLFTLSLFLEEWSLDRARKAIGSLLDLSPKLVTIKRENLLIEKKIEEVDLEEIMLIRPGERIPLDGVVFDGNGSVDQSPITGESIPVWKQEGDPLFAGTLNLDGSLEAKVCKRQGETTLAKIVEMVDSARKKRGYAERWVDQFARIYTPIMLILALVIAIAPPLLFGASWTKWMYEGLVLLVIACPCALVISTPVTIVSALTASARYGVLIKGGAHLEMLGKLKSMAFDKTGTLTLGRAKVQKIVPLNGHTERELLCLAAQIEYGSEHPLARAIRDKAIENRISTKPSSDFRLFKGLGAEATIEGKPYWIGSHRFMHETSRKESVEAHQKALELEDAGHSVVAIGDFSHICGLISLGDEIRPKAPEMVVKLKRLGIDHLALLTGDNQKTAKLLAEAVGIDRYHAELLPEDKVEIIGKLKTEYRHVGMVGDGINDTPAMAASSVGIAMGGAGSAAAFETADVVLMSDDLSQIPQVIKRSRYALRIIQQNICFSLLTKAVFVLLALFELATLWMAIAADTGTSLLVIGNALRLLKKDREN